MARDVIMRKLSLLKMKRCFPRNSIHVLIYHTLSFLNKFFHNPSICFGLTFLLSKPMISLQIPRCLTRTPKAYGLSR